MPPSLNFESPMQRQTGFATAGGFRSGDDGASNFELRDPLAATVVRDMSFAEFRAALEKSGKRFIEAGKTNKNTHGDRPCRQESDHANPCKHHAEQEPVRGRLE